MKGTNALIALVFWTALYGGIGFLVAGPLGAVLGALAWVVFVSGYVLGYWHGLERS